MSSGCRDIKTKMNFSNGQLDEKREWKPFFEPIHVIQSWKSPQDIMPDRIEYIESILFTHVIFQSTPSGPSCATVHLLSSNSRFLCPSLFHFSDMVIACLIRDNSKMLNLLILFVSMHSSTSQTHQALEHKFSIL